MCAFITFATLESVRLQFQWHGNNNSNATEICHYKQTDKILSLTSLHGAHSLIPNTEPTHSELRRTPIHDWQLTNEAT